MLFFHLFEPQASTRTRRPIVHITSEHYRAADVFTWHPPLNILQTAQNIPAGHRPRADPGEPDVCFGNRHASRLHPDLHGGSGFAGDNAYPTLLSPAGTGTLGSLGGGDKNLRLYKNKTTYCTSQDISRARRHVDTGAFLQVRASCEETGKMMNPDRPTETSHRPYVGLTSLISAPPFPPRDFRTPEADLRMRSAVLFGLIIATARSAGDKLDTLRPRSLRRD
ncbi:hypothetical protein Bbelb_224600 [Branchiostoma belcheri]|nr:hypothetical protein Bbelb_224600 [Branchiostoma belcheri]